MTPENPIVGGTVLRIPAIQSPNFVAGKTGWQINIDGSSQFANVTIVGGQIQLEDGAGNVVGTLDGTNGLVLYGNGTAANPGLTLSPLGDMIWGNFDASPLSGPSIETGSTELQLSAGADTGQTAPKLTLDTNLTDVALGTVSGIMASQPILAEVNGFVETWHALPLSNGWTNVGGTFATAQYRQMPDGTVMLMGSITGGTATTFATLPAGYRPAATVQPPVGGGTPVAANASLRVGITSAGVMTINGENAIGGSFGLDGIRFALASLL